MKIGKKDVAWGYLSLILLQAVNVVLLPFVLFYLSPKELGLWYSFTAIYGLAMLIDFGLKTTLSRNISYVWSGAKAIKSEGFFLEANKNSWSKSFFIDLIATIKSIYILMGLLIFLILISVGSIYIYTITKNQIGLVVVFSSWFLYMVAIVLNIAFAYWNSMLKGIGAIKDYNQVIIITKIIQLMLSIVLLMLGFGILGVSIAYFVSVVINRIIIVKKFYNYDSRTRDLKGNIRIKFDKDIFIKLIPNTLKTGITSAANYFILSFPVLLASYFIGLEFAGDFGIVNQIITLILTISNSYLNTYLPKFNYYRVKDNTLELRKLFKKTMIINYSINFVLFTMFLSIGSQIIQIISQENDLLPLQIMILMITYRFLYNNHSLFVSIFSTKNVIPYKTFATSSLLIVLIQLIALQFMTSIYWVILPILFVQLAFNNWYWPMIAIKDLKEA